MGYQYVAQDIFFNGIERGKDKVSWKKRLHSDFKFVIGSIDGHMTFGVRFLEIDTMYHHVNLTI